MAKYGKINLAILSHCLLSHLQEAFYFETGFVDKKDADGWFIQ